MNETRSIQQVAARCSTGLATALLVLTAACGDSTGPTPRPFRVALAAPDGAQPALFVQDQDGTNRSRIHFDGVSDDIPGNLPPFILPVRDATIRAMGPVRWTADGTRIAAVVTVAFDQSQVIVMNADGSDKRTVSPNTQIIMSNAAWSPDGTHVAYTMSTVGSTAIDLFITDIAISDITRLTNGADLGPGVTLAWTADGGSVIYGRVTDTGPPPLSQRLSRINRLEIATGKEATLAFDVPGQVFGVSTDGDWIVLVRRAADAGTQFLHDVVIRNLVDGSETVLTDVQEPVAWASITADQEHIIIAVPLFDGGLAFRMVGIDGSGEVELDAIEAAATFADATAGR